MPVSIKSQGVEIENGPATFNIVAFGSSHDPAVLEGLPPGDLEHELFYDDELEPIEVSKTALENCFKFVTDSNDIDAAAADPTRAAPPRRAPWHTTSSRAASPEL